MKKSITQWGTENRVAEKGEDRTDRHGGARRGSSSRNERREAELQARVERIKESIRLSEQARTQAGGRLYGYLQEEKAGMSGYRRTGGAGMGGACQTDTGEGRNHGAWMAQEAERIDTDPFRWQMESGDPEYRFDFVREQELDSRRKRQCALLAAVALLLAGTAVYRGTMDHQNPEGYYFQEIAGD